MNKKSGIIPILFILPVLLFISVFILKEAGGPYYLNYYDPGYVYLVNSINLLQFQGIGHTDHPGTTVQIFCAVIIKLLTLGKTSLQIPEIVFSNPEIYLDILNKSLVGLNCIALFLLGLLVYRQTSDPFMSVFVQLTPFISFEIYYGLVIVAPENFMILSVLCMCAALFYFVYNEYSGNHLTSLAIVFALICGFGTASKLNFLPICILPLIILKGFKNRIIFLTGSVIVFFVLFSPAMSKFTEMFAWAGRLAFRSGVHGQSDISMLTLSSYLENIIQILSNDLIPAIVYLLIFVILLLSLGKKKKAISEQEDAVRMRERKVLLALSITVTLHLLVVAKNYVPYAQYYIIPSLMLVVPGLAFLISYSIRTFSVLKRVKPSIAFAAAIFIVSIFSFIEFRDTVIEASEFRDESVKINNLVKEYLKTETVIPSIGAANEDCALAVCVMFGYSGNQESEYRKLFSKKVTSKVFHDYWNNKLFSISDSTNIRKVILEKGKIVVQLVPNTSIDMIIKMLKQDYNIDVKDWKLILKNENQESVYEVYL